MKKRKFPRVALFLKNNFFLLLLILICSVFTVKYLLTAFKTYYTPSTTSIDNHYTLLAKSLLKGRLDLQPGSYHFPNGDLALKNKKYYVYFGPVPGLLAIPGVIIFGDKFPFASVTILASIIIFILVYKLSRKFEFKKKDSLWISIFFVFGTIFASLVMLFFSSYQVHILSTLFIFMAIYEFFSRKRYFLIGFYLSLAMATRLTLVFAVSFFILSLLQEKINIRNKLVALVKLVLPVIVTLLLLLWYNYARFGNFLETGYSFNVNILFPTIPDFRPALKYGLFSLHHVPGNLYYFLFKGPDLFVDPKTDLPIFPFLGVDGWGLSIIFTSPLLLLPLLLSGFKKSINELITIFLIALPIVTYFGIGFVQFGYRYAIDFYPFLLLVLLRSLNGKLSLAHKALIFYSVVFDFFYMYSFWGLYPFVNF